MLWGVWAVCSVGREPPLAKGAEVIRAVPYIRGDIVRAGAGFGTWTKAYPPVARASPPSSVMGFLQGAGLQ